MSARPSYVAATFAGKCKVFPQADTFLLGYQTRWVKDEAIMKLMEKARRVGISYGTAYDRVRRHSLKTRTLDTWISSRDESSAKLVVRDCMKFSRLLNVGAKALGEIIVDEQKGLKAQAIEFANRTTINSVSSNPDAFAGKGGDVFLDEVALRDDPREVCAISFPATDWGGGVAIVSTHRGTQNYFNELITEIVHQGNPKKFSHHRVTLEDALNDGLLYKLQCNYRAGDPRLEMDEAEYFNYLKARCPDEETFLQEYMCIPGDDASAFLSYELIAGCEYRADDNWQTDLQDAKGRLFVGVDVGRTNDLTVIWVVEKLGDVNYTRRLLTLQNETFDAQEHVLYGILQLPQVQRCCIDQTGIGRQFAERAQQRFGKFKVEGVGFTGPVKEELAYPVRAAFEDKSVRVPNEAKVRSDLRAITKETTASGNIRFTADRGANGHSDRFWALALALHAAKQPQQMGALVG